MNAYQDGNNSGFNSLYAQASANQEMARRELEKKEKRRRKISMAIGVSVVLLPVLILSSIAFFNSSSGIEQGTSSDYQQEITENPNVQEAYTAQVDTLTSDLGTIVHKETPAPISEEFALPGDEISQFEKDLRKIYGQNKIAARVNPNSSILSKSRGYYFIPGLERRIYQRHMHDCLPMYM